MAVRFMVDSTEGKYGHCETIMVCCVLDIKKGAK